MYCSNLYCFITPINLVYHTTTATHYTTTNSVIVQVTRKDCTHLASAVPIPSAFAKTQTKLFLICYLQVNVVVDFDCSDGWRFGVQARGLTSCCFNRDDLRGFGNLCC